MEKRKHRKAAISRGDRPVQERGGGGSAEWVEGGKAGFRVNKCPHYCMIFLLIDRPSRSSNTRPLTGELSPARKPSIHVRSIDRDRSIGGGGGGGGGGGEEGGMNRRRVNDSAMCNFHAESILVRFDARRCICRLYLERGRSHLENGA